MTQKTHVVMLLDESGSMDPHREMVVSTFNEYKNKLAKDTKRCFMSLFLFDSRKPLLRRVFGNRKVKEVHDLTTEQYKPASMTPLVDAVGSLIDKTKERLPKKAKVLFVIHTDGYENASSKYTTKQVADMIQKMEQKRGWAFTFLGEGMDSWGQAADLGIANVARFNSVTRGQTMSKLSEVTTLYAATAKADVFGTHTLYQDAGVDPDDIEDAGKTGGIDKKEGATEA